MNQNLQTTAKKIQTSKIDWSEKDFLSPHSQHNALWGFILANTGTPDLITWVTHLIREKNIPERDEIAFAKAILEYAQNNIKFFREEPERFAAPLRTVEWGIGDCDDKSIFIATILRSFRIPVRLKLIRFTTFSKREQKEKTFKHVYPQAKINGKIYAMESVHKWPFGVDAEDLLTRKGIKVTTDYVGDF